MNFYNIPLLLILFSCVSISSGDTQSIKITLAEGSAQWWFGMSIGGATVGTSSVAIKDSSSYTSWTELKPTQWSSSVFEFVTNGNPVQLPLSVRLISSSNDVLVAVKSVTALTSGLVIDTYANYATSSTSTQQINSSTAPATPSATAAATTAASKPGTPAKSPQSSAATTSKPALPSTEATASAYTPDDTATIKQTMAFNGQAESSPNPMSPCLAGRSSWYSDSLHTGSCGFGNLLGPTGPGHTYVASASISMFGQTASCGDCFQITGPKGAVVVTVVDSCSSSRCTIDGIPHLDLSTDAYDAIADRNKTTTVYTNYRKVSCPVLGNLKVNSVGTSSALEYRLLNNRVSVINATLSSSDSKSVILLSRTNSNTWKYQGAALTFPVTLTIRSENNNVITHQFSSASATSSVVDTTSQFSGVPRLYGGSNTNAACSIPTGTTTPIIYSNDKLTTDYIASSNSGSNNDPNWQDGSFQSTINWNYRVNPYKGASCVSATLGANGAMQLVRNVGISWANDYTHLQFYIRGDAEFNQLRVGWSNGVATAISVTTSWMVKNISLVSMNAPTIIGASPNPLLFHTSLSSGAPTIYMDEIQLVKL